MEIEGVVPSDEIDPVSEEELIAFEQRLSSGMMFNTPAFLKRVTYTLRVQRTELDMLYSEVRSCVDRIRELEDRGNK